MLVVQLSLRPNDRLLDQKEELLKQSGLSSAVTFKSSSPDSITAGVDKLLQAERISQLNEDELYFVETGSLAPFSPRNELEALYHLHQLLTASSNPSCNQPINPSHNQSLNPSTDEPSTIVAQRSPNVHLATNRTSDETSQGLQSETDAVDTVDGSDKIREAAKAEVERRLTAYGDHEPAEAGEPCTGSAEKELLKWAKESGIVSKVEPAVFSSTGRGAAATADISVGETVLEVPEAMIISSLTALASDMGNAFSQVPDLDEETAALLWSMRERHVASSHWAPFFRSLPDAFHTGLSFGPAAMRELEGSPAFEGLQAAQQHLRSQYAALFPTLANAFPTLFPTSSFTWEDFLWAAELWYSYGIKVQFSDGRVRTALVPLVSLLNHSVRPHVTHFSRVDPQTRTLRLPAARPCPAGAQCFLSYGTLQSTDLLTFYGFTVDDNTYDAVQMDLELPEDDLLPRKQALLSAWGLGLSHFLRAEGVPSRLHGALRVLLMDEEELEAYGGDPRRDKVSDSNEAAVADTLLSTVDALLAVRQREADEGPETVGMNGAETESAEGDGGSGDGANQCPCTGAVVASDTEQGRQPGDGMNERRTVNVAKRYRGQQRELLLRIQRTCLDVAEAAR